MATGLSAALAERPLAHTVTDVAVIGAGPAGIAAATAAAEAGLRVTLLDELPAAGGQYLVEQLNNDIAGGAASAAERQGRKLLQQLAAGAINWLPATLVWHLERDLTLWLYRAGQSSTLRARAVILATGAREQVIPFPGWTLPGVMTVGAAQLLAKRHGVLPGKRILLAGSGPLLLAAASKLAELGADVVGVLEATHLRAWLPQVPAAWGQWERFAEGARYLRTLRAARIPYRFGRGVVCALGDDRLETAVIAQLDAQGRPLPDGQESLAVDALCVGFGLTPNIELAQLTGAEMVFAPERGGWTPRVDAYMRTTLPKLYVAGEAATVAGAGAALLAGRLAGLAAAHDLGGLEQATFEREQSALTGRLRQQARFGKLLNTLFAPPPGLADITTDDTLICRCEEVRAGEVRRLVAEGALTLDALKTWSRVGQGPCQGRTCGPILARLIAAQSGRLIQEAGVFPVRPPVKPIPLAALAATAPEMGPAA